MDPVVTCGQPAPDFSLVDLNGREHRLSRRPQGVLVLNFWSAECAWSERADPSVAAAVRNAGAQLWTIACCAGESKETIRARAEARGLGVVLLDPDQAVADAYGAAATPHVFAVDGGGILRYQGAPDDTGFGLTAPTVDHLSLALQALALGRDPDPAVTPALGCAIVRQPVG